LDHALARDTFFAKDVLLGARQLIDCRNPQCNVEISVFIAGLRAFRRYEETADIGSERESLGPLRLTLTNHFGILLSAGPILTVVGLDFD